MIHVITNRRMFEYDLHSLFRAFFPGEDVEVGYLRGLRAPGTGDVNTDTGTDTEEGAGPDADVKAGAGAGPDADINAGAAAEAGEDTSAGGLKDFSGFMVLYETEGFREGESVKSAEDEGSLPDAKPGSDEALYHLLSIADYLKQGGFASADDGADREPVFVSVRVLSCKDGDVAGTESTVLDPLKAHDRIYLKNCVKRTVYRLLSALTGQQLPWGTLTGIRPTKLSMSMLKEGADDAKITDLLKKEYYVSDKKLELSIEIAKRERAVITASSGARGFSLYMGIPFCPTTCLYCSFTSFPIALWKNRTGEYLEALKKEIRAVSELFKGRALDSVYIGGGTPTTLSPNELSGLFGALSEGFDMGSVQEFSVEAGRPDSITAEKLSVLKDIGVTRISINPQTMNGETLRLIGRRHTVAQFTESFRMAREAGFDNINMDLILGLPGEDLPMVRHTFEETGKLAPDSVTVHSMALKRAAGMAEFLREHENIKSINTPEMMELADNSLRGMGLLPYYLYRQKNMAGNLENVGYAAPGKYGVYNILMMEEVQDIVALGAGTVTKKVSFDKVTGEPTGLIERCDNVKDPGLYIERIDEMIERKRKLFSD